MATKRISILNHTLVPDSTGEVSFDALDTHGTNDQWKHLVLAFQDTANRHGVYGCFRVPDDYVGTAKVEVLWTSGAVTGDVEWDFDYRAVGGDDTESLDQTGTQESVNVNDTAPSAVFERMVIEVALTSANLAAGDLVEFFFVRDGTDAGDTMADEALVFDVLFQYSDA